MIQLRTEQLGLNLMNLVCQFGNFYIHLHYPLEQQRMVTYTLHTAGKMEILIFYCWIFQQKSTVSFTPRTPLSKQVTDTCDVSACRTDQRINRASKFPTWWDSAALPGDWWVENKVPPSTLVKYNSYILRHVDNKPSHPTCNKEF